MPAPRGITGNQLQHAGRRCAPELRAIGQDGPPPDLQLRSIAVSAVLLRHHAGLPRRLVRIVRRASGSVVTWRRAQMGAAVRSGHGRGGDCEGRVHQRGPGRDVIRNFSADGFSSLYPKYRGGRAPKFTWSSAGRWSAPATWTPAMTAPPTARPSPALFRPCPSQARSVLQLDPPTFTRLGARWERRGTDRRG
jgi:hypothetical protein